MRRAPLPEILAPAGDFVMLGAAVRSGADAVYLGLSGFNARRSAGNFTAETLPQAVAFCHARGVRVHVALNTLVFARELDGLAAAVRAVAEAGADAVIADDLATAKLVKAIAPGLPLHASTQMTIHTPAGAKAMAALGYQRVILARELTLAEIREIVAASPIECEVFVHGALCFAVSGQCMMSAFLGGRSGNRGGCAGPCRLPFDAAPGLRPGQPGRACHLSLKDMDHIPHLRELAEAGVASVKIEGRLRPPEYAAAAVAACRAARDGLPYDAQLLEDIFSRSGFTDGYLTGKRDASLFGVRTETDAARSKAAAPKARELYRREYQRVPVAFAVTLRDGAVRLTADDGEGHRAEAVCDTAPQPAQKDQRPGIENALRKTGGTPFLAGDVSITPQAGGLFLPGGAWNALRREVLDQLLTLREQPRPHAVQPYTLPQFPARPHRSPVLAARFERWAQVPEEWTERLAFWTLPISEAGNVPAAYRAKTVLELPRVLFGGAEQALRRQLETCAGRGFQGFEVNNLAHLTLCQETAAAPLYGGLGLNVTNPLAARAFAEQGVHKLLLHPETPAAAMDGFAQPTAALCYGHVPVMLTRACPLRNLHGCAGCARQGTLRDRKGRDFVLRCAKPHNDVRTIYNPVPLYMGDRLRELPVDAAVAYFTNEPQDRAARVLALLAARAPFDKEFTRGLYYYTEPSAQK